MCYTTYVTNYNKLLSKAHFNEVFMIGETKLWKFNKVSREWEIIKIFSNNATILDRLAWLDIIKEDNPESKVLLSQHHPEHSVGG